MTIYTVCKVKLYKFVSMVLPGCYHVHFLSSMAVAALYHQWKYGHQGKLFIHSFLRWSLEKPKWNTMLQEMIQGKIVALHQRGTAGKKSTVKIMMTKACFYVDCFDNFLLYCLILISISVSLDTGQKKHKNKEKCFKF